MSFRRRKQGERLPPAFVELAPGVFVEPGETVTGSDGEAYTWATDVWHAGNGAVMWDDLPAELRPRTGEDTGMRKFDVTGGRFGRG